MIVLYPDRKIETTTPLDAAALRAEGRPVVHDPAHDVWSVGDTGASRRARREMLEAPDFRLPDLDGRTHTLSEHRGHRVFLVSWASW
jgi:hypothetical protein